MKWGGESEVDFPPNWRPHEHSFAVLYIEHQWHPNFGEMINACLRDCVAASFQVPWCNLAAPELLTLPLTCALVTRLGLQLTLS